MKRLGNRLLTLIFAVFLYGGCGVAFAQNLIKNGDFAALSGERPTGWSAQAKLANLTYDTAEKPDGVAGSLKVEIIGSANGQGEIMQKVPVSPGGSYYLEAWVNSSSSEKGFIQIKLFKNKKELRRISASQSGKGWQKVTKEFEVGDADEVGVLLRYVQGASQVGRSLWFANLSLIPADQRVRTAPAISKLEGVATFNSIGVYVNVTGDMSTSTTSHLVFREEGESAWRPSLGLVWHGQTEQFRGSLLNLKENTRYEFKAWLEDAHMSAQPVPATAVVTTWSSEVPIAKTIYLPPGESTAPLVITESGTAEGWIRYTSDPTKHSILNVDMNGKNAILLANVSHVILENLTIRGGIEDAVVVSKSTDIRVRRCDISQWGEPGTLTPTPNPKWGPGPFFLNAKGERINLQAGVRVSTGAARVVVENCFIHHPRGRATSWDHGHPLGPTAIIMANSDGNHVIRNNDLIGSEEHRFNDTIEGAWNNYVQGGPHRDTDVVGNILFFSNDDGIELDGGQMNVRMFNNWIASSYCGISTAPTLRGPSYIYRNLIVLEGEERYHTNFALKVGGDKDGEPGKNFFFHNTIYSHGKGLRAGNWGEGPTPLQTRNNLFALGEILYPQKRLGDFDYDMLRPGSLDPALDTWQQNGVVGVEKFRDRDAGDYRLSENSLAIGRGVRLPMVNDEAGGGAPDIGAFPVGADPLFPIRDGSFSLLPMSGRVEMVFGEGTTQAAKLTVIAPKATGQNWRVISDAPWIRFLPESGPCDGRPHEITLSFAPDTKREGLHRGAVTVRTDSGFNRTSFIKGYARLKNPIVQLADAVDLEHAGFQVVEETDAPVKKSLQAPATRAETASAYFKIKIRVEQPGNYYLHALTYVPGPGAPGHDSMFVQVDEGEPELWPLSISAPSAWMWQTSSIFRKHGTQVIPLDAGDHVITVRGREPTVKIARVAFSNSSLPPVE